MADPSEHVKKFLGELAADPTKLGKFILDPDAAMNAAGIPDDQKGDIKSGVKDRVNTALGDDPESFAFVA